VKYLLFLITVTIFSCNQKPTASSLDNFDMSKFCDRYIILKNPRNAILYIMINKKDGRRFVIYKDYNYYESGYGYVFSNILSDRDAVEHGVFQSAEEAVRKAEEKYPAGSSTFDVNNIVPNGRNEWLFYGKILYGLC
jgi:hypothetical protein